MQNVSEPMKADVCFLVDVTASMDPWLNAVVAKLAAITEAIRAEYKGIDLRVAFVGYRDYADEEHFVIHDFTSDIEAVLQTMASIRPSGGSDIAEDVFGGIQKVLSLNWRRNEKAARRLIHVADSPGHGKLWNGGAEDDHADFDDDGRQGRALMQDLVKKNRTDYIFMEIQSETRAMTDRLKKEYDSITTNRALDMEVTQLNADVAIFVEKMLTSIVQSVNTAYRVKQSSIVVTVEGLDKYLVSRLGVDDGKKVFSFLQSKNVSTARQLIDLAKVNPATWESLVARYPKLK